MTTNDLIAQQDAPWGLARISHRATGETTYVYDESAGEGTCAYIIDTGIYVNHTVSSFHGFLPFPPFPSPSPSPWQPDSSVVLCADAKHGAVRDDEQDFGGRATWLANFIDGADTDGHGHGTHVAGTVGGSRYGVAKRARLFAVKVLRADGSGTLSSMVAGIDFAASDAAARRAAGECAAGSVANLSLGSGRSEAVNSAAAAAVRAGVFLSVAAGNSNSDARFYSPASEETVCTVGATGVGDARAWFSNYGAVVDVFAPGVDVLSSWIGSPTATVRDLLPLYPVLAILLLQTALPFPRNMLTGSDAPCIKKIEHPLGHLHGRPPRRRPGCLSAGAARPQDAGRAVPAHQGHGHARHHHRPPQRHLQRNCLQRQRVGLRFPCLSVLV